jgi:endonuclease/exonuclease/phosphatase family metal-dependent hydrolase
MRRNFFSNQAINRNPGLRNILIPAMMAKQSPKQKISKAGKKRKVSISAKLFLFLNALAVLPLLGSYLAAYIPPESFWPVAFLGLAFPALVFINLIFVFFWLLLLRRYFLISLLALLVGWSHIGAHLRFNSKVNADNLAGKIKIMSYNVRLFDLYNWKDSKSKVTRDKIFDLIYSESPDILCIQEFYGGDKRHFNVLDTLLSFKCAKYSHVSYIKSKRSDLPIGIAIFSKYPIIRNKEVTYENSKDNFCIYSDLLIANDTVRVINTHLESIRLGREDYLFVNDLASNHTENHDIGLGSKKIFGKMRSAYIKRAEQVRSVRKEIEQSPYPVVLCGDFNDTPSSYVYHKISQKLDDAFVEAGYGMGKSYAGVIPLFRIDYIFHDISFVAYNFITLDAEFSDHYPITSLLVRKHPR